MPELAVPPSKRLNLINSPYAPEVENPRLKKQASFRRTLP